MDKEKAEGVGFEPTSRVYTPRTRFRVERGTAWLRYPSSRREFLRIKDSKDSTASNLRRLVLGQNTY